MCGIFGIVDFSGNTGFSSSEIETACNTMYHRGPDESGYYYEPGVALCHRRLSIIDIGGGKQPMSSADGNLIISYNGEIYNFIDIKNDLLKKGYVFVTNSDTEVLLYAFSEYGEKCFGLFNGMFAVSIWNKQRKTLTLARDRMGKKPLYYKKTNNGVIFSSELKSIYKLSKENKIDYKSLQDYFTFGYIPTPRTIYEGINKLEPSTYLNITIDKFEMCEYWDLSFKTDDSITYNSAKQNVETLLNKSVQDRLISDVPFGAFLSGGIDSSIVVSMMQQHLSSPVKTFSIGFDVAKYNELDDARKISNYIGTDHTEFVMESRCTDIVDEFAKFYDEPFGDSSSLPTYYVSKLAKDHVKMVLTGDGGDEIFGGYKRYSRQLINNRIKHYAPYAKCISGLLHSLPFNLSKKVSNAIDRSLHDYPYNYLMEVALSTTDTARKIINSNDNMYDAYNTLAPLFTSGSDELNNIYYGDIKSYMLDDILVKVDRMSMANSIEVRSPFLDMNLVEYSSKLTPFYKTSRKSGKIILRDIAKKYIPYEIIHNKKKGFAIPLSDWFHSDLMDMLTDLVSANRGNGILNYNYIDTLIYEHTNKINDNSELLWLVLCFEIWCSEYHNA